jgi:NADH:ubiquinone oxidoreductase subunit E
MTMADQDKLETILSRYDGGAADLIPVLHDIQEEFNYLPKDELKIVAHRLNVPLTQVYSVATFYKGFSLEPLGVHHVRVCRGTTCHLHGGTRLQEGVSRRLGIEPGQTTQDGQFSLEGVKCVGKCGAAPVLAVDEDFFGEVGVDTLTKIIKTYRKPK